MSNIKLWNPRVLKNDGKGLCLCRLCIPDLLMLYALSTTFQYIMFSVMLAHE